MTGNGEGSKTRRSTLVGGVVIVAVAFLVVLGSRLGWFAPEARPSVIVLYGFSILNDVMQDGLLPAFRERWRQGEGEVVEFAVTFAGSGEITGRILGKYAAEIAIVGSELDAHRLPVPWRSWRSLPHAGVLARTPLVIVTREGNPHGLRGFDDLAGKDLEIVHADPLTSGVGELGIVAEYGSALRRRGDSELAYLQLLGTWRNIVLKVPSARDARQRFEEGRGDVIVTYEADAIGTPARGPIAGVVVYPTATLVAEPVVVEIEKNIDDRQRRPIDALIEFLWTREAQQILVDYGFVSVLDDLDAPRSGLSGIADPFSLEDLGGNAVRTEILEREWKRRVLPELAR